MTVYFHANFGLNRKNMAGLLKLALENPNIDDNELASSFGYGAPFAARTRSWLNKTGIIELGLPVHLTPKGQIVLAHDPDLESILTQWFLHWELTQDSKRAEAWHFFANEFLPKNEVFSKEDLMKALAIKLRPHSEKHFAVGSPLNEVITRKLIECYLKDYALGKIRIIRSTNDLFYRVRDAGQIGPWDSIGSLQKSYKYD